MSRFARPWVAALIALCIPAYASADSWPTSVGLSQVTLEDGKTYQAYSGQEVGTPAESRRFITQLLRHIKDKGNSYAEVYGVVQLADSAAFNASTPAQSAALKKQFERGLKRLAESGEGANAQLASAVHGVYEQLRGDTAPPQVLKSASWRQLRRLQKVVKDPAMDLIAAALINDVVSHHAWGDGSESPARVAKAKKLIPAAEKLTLKAAAKITMQGRSASKHTRALLASFVDYGKWYPLVNEYTAPAQQALAVRGNSATKIAKLQQAAVGLAAKRNGRFYRLPGYPKGQALHRLAPRTR